MRIGVSCKPLSPADTESGWSAGVANTGGRKTTYKGIIETRPSQVLFRSMCTRRIVHHAAEFGPGVPVLVAHNVLWRDEAKRTSKPSGGAAAGN